MPVSASTVNSFKALPGPLFYLFSITSPDPEPQRGELTCLGSQVGDGARMGVSPLPAPHSPLEGLGHGHAYLGTHYDTVWLPLPLRPVLARARKMAPWQAARTVPVERQSPFHRFWRATCRSQEGFCRVNCSGSRGGSSRLRR